MVRHADNREREEEILDLIVDSYIKESRPISSGYLCKRYSLPCSSATIRNIMESLEKKGYLSHIHTSSGRVPTKEGFKHYVGQIKEEEAFCDYPVSIDFCALPISGVEGVIGHTLDVLAEISGYTSLVALSGKDERLFFRGTRFILEQPEFEDITRLKNLFYTLEVRINELQELLFNYVDERVRILIGDEIGFEEISDCSLVISGSKNDDLTFALALLGPMRMDYVKAVSCLKSIRGKLKNFIGELA